MADNSLSSGGTGDLISTDVLTSINSGPPSGAGEKVQRMKVGFGVDGDLNDVNINRPLPVSDPSITNALSNDTPLGTFLAGDPAGDFAGTAPIEDWMKGVYAPNISTPDLVKGGNNGGLVLADSAQPITAAWTAATPNGTVLFLVDTTGFNSISIQTTGLSSGTLMGFSSNFLSSNSADWVPVTGLYSSVGSSTTTVPTVGSVGVLASFNAANVIFQFPTVGRYFRFATVTSNSAGGCVAILRQQPCVLGVTLGTNITTVTNSIQGNAPLGGVPVLGRVAASTAIVTRSDTTTYWPTLTSNASLVVEKHAIPELTWNYAPPTAGLVNTTTAVTIKAAVAGQKGYISAIQLQHEPLGAATEFAIRDGAAGTVLWRIKLPITTAEGGVQYTFDPPLRQAAVNTLLEIVTLTASVTGAVYFNAQGFMSN